MKVYKYIAENEKKRYTFYFTFSVSEHFFLSLLLDEISRDINIYDIFPEPYTEKISLKESLSVRNENGKEVFVNKGTEVEMLSTFRVLFGLDND